MYHMDSIAHQNIPAKSGREIVSLMRKMRITIAQLAEANDISKARVRQLRSTGVPNGFRAWEILKMVEVAKVTFK